MSSELLIVQSDPRSGPGRFAEWWTAAGVRYRLCAAYDGEPVPGDLSGWAGLVVLGGAMMPDDDATGPWLPAVRHLAGQALRDRTAYLGVCLGGQLLARVAGGEVRAAHGAPEMGSTGLTVRPEAAGDPVFGGLPAAVTCLEHHVDRVTALPPDATWLVRSDACPYQAFRCGTRAWGMQFHPESTGENIARWNVDHLAALGLTRRSAAARMARDDAVAAPLWHRVALAFAAVAGALPTGG